MAHAVDSFRTVVVGVFAVTVLALLFRVHPVLGIGALSALGFVAFNRGALMSSR